MFEKVKENVSKIALGGAGGVATALLSTAPTWAAEGDFAITSAMVSPITTAITSGVQVLVPVGITIMGIMVGVSLIPRIIYKFL